MIFWPFRTSTAPNTLGLGGDGDEVEMLEDVERRFSIGLVQKEVEMLVTMGDLEGLVSLKSNEDLPSEDIWERLCEIARHHSAHDGPIDRYTTFFAKFAQPRETKNG